MFKFSIAAKIVRNISVMKRVSHDIPQNAKCLNMLYRSTVIDTATLSGITVIKVTSIGRNIIKQGS